MIRIVLLASLLLVVGCSGAPIEAGPVGARVTPATVEAPADPSVPPAEAHPTSLLIDETFDAWAQLGIEDAVAGWCALEPTLCLAVTVGPVTLGQANTVMRDTTTEGCPWYGQEHRDTAQITIPDSCATKDRENHMTVGLIAAHELGHFFGALHVPAPNNIMSGGGPRSMARCTSYADLAEVCSHHDCTAPRFDLVCTDAEAAASNPFAL